VRAFGMRCIVAVNRFPSDTDRELALVKELAMQFGADDAVINDGFTRGGEGSVELGRAVLGATRNGSNFAPIYPPTTPIREQIQTLARRLYGAADVEFLPECQKRIDWLTERGMGTLPVCMSKTHLSLSHDPSLKARPRLHAADPQRVSLGRRRFHRGAGRRYPADARSGQRAGVHAYRDR